MCACSVGLVSRRTCVPTGSGTAGENAAGRPCGQAANAAPTMSCAPPLSPSTRARDWCCHRFRCREPSRASEEHVLDEVTETGDARGFIPGADLEHQAPAGGVALAEGRGDEPYAAVEHLHGVRRDAIHAGGHRTYYTDVGSADRPLSAGLATIVAGLLTEVEEAADQLGDEEASSDIEELAGAPRKGHRPGPETSAMAPGPRE